MPDNPQIKGLLYTIKIIILTTIAITIFGYIDFKTGEVSLDVFYLLILCLCTWYTNVYIGILCVTEIMFAKITADFYDNIKIGTHLYEWNSLSFLLMYLITCILVGKLKKVLSK